MYQLFQDFETTKDDALKEVFSQANSFTNDQNEDIVQSLREEIQQITNELKDAKRENHELKEQINKQIQIGICVELQQSLQIYLECEKCYQLQKNIYDKQQSIEELMLQVKENNGNVHKLKLENEMQKCETQRLLRSLHDEQKINKREINFQNKENETQIINRDYDYNKRQHLKRNTQSQLIQNVMKELSKNKVFQENLEAKKEILIILTQLIPEVE